MWLMHFFFSDTWFLSTKLILLQYIVLFWDYFDFNLSNSPLSCRALMPTSRVKSSESCTQKILCTMLHDVTAKRQQALEELQLLLQGGTRHDMKIVTFIKISNRKHWTRIWCPFSCSGWVIKVRARNFGSPGQVWFQIQARVDLCITQGGSRMWKVFQAFVHKWPQQGHRV